MNADAPAAALRAELAETRARLERAGQARRADQFSREAEREYLALLRQIPSLERAVALANGAEAAVPIHWDVPWDTGAPLPHVLASGSSTCLIYLAGGPSPGEAGWPETISIDPLSPEPRSIALVEFVECAALRFGDGSDDEDLDHPLYGAGLEFYAAHVVANSRWLAAMREMDPPRAADEAVRWQHHQHYLLMFHDDSFECLATGHRIEVFQGSFAGVLEIARLRLFAPG